MWNKRLTQLNDALSTMIYTFGDAVPYLLAAGINPGMVPAGGNALVIWNNIISYADNNGQLDDLVNALLAKYPKNPHLLTFKEAEEKDYSLGPDIKNTEWKGEELDNESLEKITGETSTLLPISFLQVGLEKARTVARVVIPLGGGRMEVGSGFLIDNNRFITNNHVINSIDKAKIAKIQFDYEESVDGNPIQMTEFTLDPAKGFGTSAPDDWTLIKVKGDANKKFGAVPLEKTTVSKGDFVNIIQHPGGRFKQIGMYHNLVTFSNEKIVQYLTDTEPGSSGSPVFNSQWQLVALHHSGGMLKEPGATQRLLRNEGININQVIAGIKAAGL
jgi:V8-like Glu-specific endopeptidase